MDGHTDKRSPEEIALREYVALAEVLDCLRLRAAELEDCVDALDSCIEGAESSGLGEAVESLCESRNRLNLSRIELELQANGLEKRLLEFEKIRQMTR